MRSAFSSIARPRTEIRSGSPGPAPTISMCPRRWARMSRVAATVVLAFAFRHYQLAISGGDSNAAASLTLGVPMCFITVLLGWGVHCRQFLGRIEEDFVFLLERFHYRFVTLDVNRRYGYDGLRGDVVLFQLFYNAFHNFSRGLACRASPMPTCTTRGTHSRWTVCPLYNVFAERRSVPA